MTSAKTLTWFDFEETPVSWTGDPGDPVVTLDADAVRGASQAVLDRLREITDDVDGAFTCQVPPCTQHIGFTLDDDDESPSRGAISWHWVTLVEGNGAVTATCDGCTPSNMFTGPPAPSPVLAPVDSPVCTHRYPGGQPCRLNDDVHRSVVGLAEAHGWTPRKDRT